MTTYQLGERVWAMTEGYPWWPAKVVSPEEFGQESQEGADTMIQYYGTGDLAFFDSSDVDHLVPFEDSSSKAATADPALEQAIADCRGDVTAQPLRDDPSVNQMGGGARGANLTADEMADLAALEDEYGAAGAGENDDEVARMVQQKFAGRKRGRGVEKKSSKKQSKTQVGQSTFGLDDDDDYEGDDRMLVQEFAPASNEQLVGFKAQIDEAVAAVSIPDLRAVLLQCAGVLPSFQQLKTTQVGVSVGNLYSNSQFAPLQPLVQAIVCHWAHKALPSNTLKSIEQIQRFAQVSGGVSALPDQQQQGGQQQQQQQTAASSASTGNKTLDAIRNCFTAHPQEISDLGLQDADVTAVAQRILDKMPELADLKRATQHLRNPEHDELRSHLLNGKLSVDEFSGMIGGDVMTRAEREEVERKESLINRSDKPVGQITAQYECPKCQANNATFYEKQIRSADEPATVFLDCLECKNSWRVD